MYLTTNTQQSKLIQINYLNSWRDLFQTIVPVIKPSYLITLLGYFRNYAYNMYLVGLFAALLFMSR